MLDKINNLAILVENNIRSILILSTIIMIIFVSLILCSWLAGFWLNGLYLYKFELASCWSGLSAVIAGIGSILTIAGVNIARHYIDSKYNSNQSEMPNSKERE